MEKKTTEEVFEVTACKFEAYTGDEPYLFVSYSHRDSAQVYPILDHLHDFLILIESDSHNCTPLLFLL